MILRHYFLLAALVLSAHVTGCRPSRGVTDERPNAGIVPPAIGMPADSPKAGLPPVYAGSAGIARLDTVRPSYAPMRLSLFRRLFPVKQQAPERQAGHSQAPVSSHAQPVPRKCKGCQITYVTGDNNRVAQATAGKVKAPTVQASDSATQQTATNAVAGRGNTATQTATVQEAPGFWARFAQPLGYVACIAGIIGAGYLLYLIWAFIPRRRNDNA